MQDVYMTGKTLKGSVDLLAHSSAIEIDDILKLPHGGVTLQIANSWQKVASPLIWWKRGSSRSFGGLALSLPFHAGRAAMPHIAMVSITAIMRTIN
jgi:hypothetical protein